VAVDHQRRFAALGPGAFELGELDLDREHAGHAARVAHRMGDEEAGHAGGGADGEELARAARERGAEIGAEGVVLADEGIRAPPVARRQRVAVGADQVQHGRAGARVDVLEQGIGLRAQTGIVRSGEQRRQHRMAGEHRGQALEAQQLGVEAGRQQGEALPGMARDLVHTGGEPPRVNRPQHDDGEGERQQHAQGTKHGTARCAVHRVALSGPLRRGTRAAR